MGAVFGRTLGYPEGTTGVYADLVTATGFKPGVTSEQDVRWVRFPSTSAFQVTRQAVRATGLSGTQAWSDCCHAQGDTSFPSRLHREEPRTGPLLPADGECWSASGQPLRSRDSIT